MRCNVNRAIECYRLSIEFKEPRNPLEIFLHMVKARPFEASLLQLIKDEIAGVKRRPRVRFHALLDRSLLPVPNPFPSFSLGELSISALILIDLSTFARWLREGPSSKDRDDKKLEAKMKHISLVFERKISFLSLLF